MIMINQHLHTKLILLAIVVAVVLPYSKAFQSSLSSSCLSIRTSHLLRAEEQWTGEVVADEDGRIKGCTITTVSETDFTIEIDGEAADLGKFSTVVYRKITNDAKQQSFQGFRPGTIPPHLLPSYKVFAMNEVALEATLEAMQQNNIRPFESCRENILIENISIPPKKQRKKKKKRKKKVTNTAEVLEEEVDTPPAWQKFDTLQEALKGGWEPGQSFSFVAKNCKGQKVDQVETERPPVI